jgi:hypothetical protein
MAPRLGLEFAKAIIPDEVLSKIKFKGIFAYRDKSKDVYKAWNVELNNISAKIGDADLRNPEETIRKLIATELIPGAKLARKAPFRYPLRAAADPPPTAKPR